jgi:acetyl-CoA synthetase
MTRGLWNDSARYLNSYWGKWPELWVHGDTAQIDADGFWFISGRSDDTLKITGKRTGPSEIETLVMATGLAGEVAAIGLPDLIKGETVGLFVTLMPGVAPDAKTRKCLIDAVISGLGAAFRPSSVLFVKDIPKTRNMKIMRRIVRAVYLGLEPGDLSSLVNPESLDCIAEVIGT